MTSGENSPGVFRLTVSPPMRWSSRSSGMRQERPGARAQQDVAERTLIRARLGDVGDLGRLARHGHAARRRLRPVGSAVRRATSTTSSSRLLVARRWNSSVRSSYS